MATDLSIITIPLGQVHTYEAGAILFVYLAFPGHGEEAEETRGRVHASLCSLALQATAQENDAANWTEQSVKLGYAIMTESEIRVNLRTFDSNFEHRLQAATMAKPFIQEVIDGEEPRLPAGVERLTLTAMADWRERTDKPELDHTDPGNFLTRVWRPSLPVLHVALAVNALYEKTRAAGLGKPPIHDLIRSPESIKFVVETAQALEEKILRVSKLGLNPEKLWRFRLA